MQQIRTIKNSLLSMSIAGVLATGLLSCNGGNNNTADSNSVDSTHMMDNTAMTSANSDGQDRIIYDSSINTTNTNSTNSAADNTSMEASFMMKAAEINLEEIKLGKLAQQKGTISHVKALGKMMVTEHEKAMTELTALAKTKMVNIPTTEPEKIMYAYKTLSEKTGKIFDKAFSGMMVDGHKEAIAFFEKTNMETKDAAIKNMTSKMIPELKTHLEHAVMCQKECEKQ